MIQVQALVLCGGKSSRMGSRKERLQICGVSLLDYISNVASTAIELQFKSNAPVLISGPGGIEDLHPKMGPLSGIHAVLKHFQQLNFATSPKYLLILPVDLPLLRPSALMPLLHYATSTLSAVAYETTTLPLLIQCSTTVLQAVETLLDPSGKPSARSLRALLEKLDSQQISPFNELDLMNCNTPQDWTFAHDILEKRNSVHIR